jgi:uncharacterized protein Yka (UPF0111/DUF47 family)
MHQDFWTASNHSPSGTPAPMERECPHAADSLKKNKKNLEELVFSIACAIERIEHRLDALERGLVSEG